LQNFISTGDEVMADLNDIQVRFEELPSISNKFKIAQNESETTDDADQS
jgi:hypothetical protein